MKIVFIGLTITSSWGNGHATTYRGLLRELDALGHEVTFLEHDKPWYAGNRDLPEPPFGATHLYGSFAELKRDHEAAVRDADVVIVGSYVPEAVAVGRWVLEVAEGLRCFYDIDTPVTLGKLARGDYEYITPELIAAYDAYFSFAGGRALRVLAEAYGSPAARALYCSFDRHAYHPEPSDPRWDLAYLGTYSDDRQPKVEAMLNEPARRRPTMRFCVAGPQYPAEIDWPANVERIDHLPPAEHRSFYNRQRFCLNVTREDMVRLGHSPSVRLFEAAACGTPIISDEWAGLDELFEPGREILIAHTSDDVERYLSDLDETQRRQIGTRARKRVIEEHSAAARARQLEAHLEALQPARGNSAGLRFAATGD